ncbi:MAG: hypothetical protein ACLFRY_13805 [Spirochaetia bacterium]
MNSFEIRSLADCYNGSLVREFDFAEPIGEALIGHLGRNKKLDYFPDLPKPYFRIEAKGKYIIRGMRGSFTMRVILKQPHPEMNLFSLKSAIEDFFLGAGRPPVPGKTALPGAGPAPAEVPARTTTFSPKAVRTRVPNGFDRKHFSARWRLNYLTRRDSGS